MRRVPEPGLRPPAPPYNRALVRVLTIGNFYPPHHFGGYEQVWGGAVQHLRTRGHEVRVLATTYRHPEIADGAEPDVYRALRWYWRERKFDIPGERLPLARRYRLERHNHAVFDRHMRDFRPDVVSFWSMGGMSHSLIEAARRHAIPMVAFVHDEALDYGRFTDQWLRLFYPSSRRRAARLVELMTGLPTVVDYSSAGRYVFVSEFVRSRALKLPLGLRDTAVAHSGIDPAFVAPELQQRDWRWRLLYVGRLDPKKGTEDAVAALAQLPAEATLTFAGSWDVRDERALAERVADLGLDGRVTMLGQVPHEDLPAVYRDHDAVLFPVRWEEPWGLVPLEAMASGCLVVATGRGGSAEYLRDGHNCLLASVADPASLAACVRRLADSADLRARLRERGADTAPRHTETVFNTNVERHLLDAAGAGAAGRVPTLA
jgi:glycogen synthase